MFLHLRLCVFLQFSYHVAAAPESSPRFQINQHYIRAVAAHKKLEKILSRNDMQIIITFGVLDGAVQTKNEIENYLIEIIADLILNASKLNDSQIIKQIQKINKQVARDRKAIEILSTSIDLVTKVLSVKEFQQEMHVLLLEYKKNSSWNENKNNVNATKMMDILRKNIENQIDKMKELISDKVDGILQGLIEDKFSQDDGGSRNKLSDEKKNKTLEAEIRYNLIGANKRRRETVHNNTSREENPFSEEITDNNIEGINNVTALSTNSGPQPDEIDSPELMSNDKNMPIGLAGLIASLSGGENGSDVGALIGALTGLVSMLFGPGGLDVESLISSATSLFAGLLAGNKNFGTVLGEYVGTAFDGLSGGGGAINNGKFIGNFFGTVIASSSANPEDDEKPFQPGAFVENLLRSFLKSSNRHSSDSDATEENFNDGDVEHFDSFSFVKQISSSIVAGIVGIILNTSLGSSAGASQGSATAFHSLSKSNKHIKL